MGVRSVGMRRRSASESHWASAGPFPVRPEIKKFEMDARAVDAEAGRIAFKARQLRARFDQQSLVMSMLDAGTPVFMPRCGEVEIHQLADNLQVLRHTLEHLEEETGALTEDDTVALTDERRSEFLELAIERELCADRIFCLGAARQVIERQLSRLVRMVDHFPTLTAVHNKAREEADEQMGAVMLLVRKRVLLEKKRRLAQIIEAKDPRREAERVMTWATADSERMRRRIARAQRSTDAICVGAKRNWEWLAGVLVQQMKLCMRAFRRGGAGHESEEAGESDEAVAVGTPESAA